MVNYTDTVLRNTVPVGATNCRITVHGNIASITGSYPLRVVHDATSYFVDGFRFSAAYRLRKWDGKKHFFNVATGTFPAGLTASVVEELRKADKTSQIEIQDTTEWPKTANLGFQLAGVEFTGKYDYQLKAAQALVAGKRGIAKIATNGGKSELAIAITKYLGLPTLFLVERISLVHQTRKRFATRLNMPIEAIGIIGDSHYQLADITVATPASLISRMDLPEVQQYASRWKVIFADECHHVSSELFYSVMNQLQAPYRFGLSGTPLDRTDGSDMRLLAQTGPVLYEVSNKTLVERGISVSPEVYIVRLDKPAVPKNAKWAEVHATAIVGNSELNSQVASKAIEYADKGLQILVLVEKIQHGNNIMGLLKASRTKHKSVYLTGKESGEVREAAFDEFRAGVTRIMVATTILDEGVDIPNIDVLILAGGGKAKIRLLQRVGRGLRTGQGKERLVVIDFALFCHPWLIKHSLQRLRTYKAEECFEIRMSR